MNNKKYFNKIYLVGPMGSGKSTIGRLLAKKLKLPFCDTDTEIETRSGVSLNWIFDKEGEKGFRIRETKLLSELSITYTGMIISTGGGTIASAENQALLLQSGFIVFLEASVKTQLNRTYRDKKRPLLQGNIDRKVILKTLYSDREAIYHSLAQLIVSTNEGTPHIVIKKIIQSFSEWKQHNHS
ncbi:MAG: shikimate kinase [Endozoicomonadaceae bacterium]|nr:shikimate kinase [Endozoicomonadaceae bacterium]